MRCRILHVSGSPQQTAPAIAEAINDFTTMNVVHAGGFSAYFVAIRIASTDWLDETAINKKIKGAKICFVDANEQHHIFVDRRTPKITAAGWYDGPFQFGVNFPRCTFIKMCRPPPHPLARYAQFCMILRGVNMRLHSCEFLPKWTEELATFGQRDKDLQFILIINGRAVERSMEQFNPLNGPSFICGVPPSTEFTLTGEGVHGEYIVLNRPCYNYNLVDAKIIMLC